VKLKTPAEASKLSFGNENGAPRAERAVQIAV
jgi:hypothetical protein